VREEKTWEVDVWVVNKKGGDLPTISKVVTRRGENPLFEK